jgi:alkylated DNA repair dioxygenase AlkB
VTAGFDHTRGWVPARAAADALARLTAELPWSQPEVRVFGRSSPTPRLVCAMGDAPYSYSGVRHVPAPWHPVADLLRARLEYALGARFNTCLANLYRDGTDSIGWHSDDEPELGPEPVIASLSLGAARTFAVRARDGAERASFELGSGDLVVMRGRAQADYQHSVPRRLRVREPRLNLTFRLVR